MLMAQPFVVGKITVYKKCSGNSLFQEKGGDNIFILLGARIRTDETVIGFRDVQCEKQVSLRGRSEDEIREILSEDAGG